MNQERLMKVLVGPIVSEKSTMIGEKHNQYSFVVVPDAKKSEVKAAVEGAGQLGANSEPQGQAEALRPLYGQAQ